MRKILIVEDSLPIREIIAAILALSDYIVLQAENGAQGVEMAKKELPDLILCDILMPDLDGFAVLRILSKNRATSAIPFIFLSSKNDTEDLRLAMNLGASDYLIKPVEKNKLLEAIEARLQRKASFESEAESVELLSKSPGALKSEIKVDFINIFQDAKVKTVTRKEKIYQENDYANYVFFLEAGKVKCFKADAYGKEYVTGIYFANETFGHSPILTGNEYSETAIALEDSRLMLLPKRTFLQVMRTNAQFSLKFIDLLSHNIRENETKMLQLAYATVRERLAETLFRFRKENGLGDTELSGISRDDLASIIGTTKESLVRTLADFKREGSIETSGKDIFIRDEGLLRKNISIF